MEKARFLLYNKLMSYLILGDIKNSKLADPKKLWKKLNQITLTINNKYKAKLSTPMVITLGDEFQVVANNKLFAKEIVKELLKKIKPYELRMVVAPFYLNTKNFNTLKKFNKLMKKRPVNPLISKSFIKAHDLLDKKDQDFYGPKNW